MILVAAGAVSFVGAATDEVGPIDEPGSTPFPAAAATLSNPAGTTIAVHLVAPVAAPDESAWQTELRVVVLQE